MTTATREWRPASIETPCPICGKANWCSIGGRMIHCMRIESERGCHGGGWLHANPEDDGQPIVLPPRKPRKSPEELDAIWRPIVRRGACSMLDLTPLANTLGVAPWALKALEVGRDAKGSWLFPEKNADELYIGLSRRLNTPMANGTNKLCVKGSRRGICYMTHWQDMPGPIYIVEGGSDVAAGLTLGLAVLGRPNNTGGAAILAKLLRGETRRIVVVAERDRKEKPYMEQYQHAPDCRCCPLCWPGMHGARFVAAALSRLLQRDIEVALPVRYKDLREWLVHGHLDLNDTDAVNAATARWHKEMSH